MCKKIISLVLCIFTLANAAAISVAAAHLPITETLETPLAWVWSDSSLGIDSSLRLAQTPEEYVFSMSDGADNKKYILLKNVNAKENDGFFVMTDGYTENGVSYDSNNYNITDTDKKGTKTAESLVYDPERSGSVAQRLNDESYMAKHFPHMKDYINTHTWYTERGCKTENGYEIEPYKTDCKISLLSLTEYKANFDRIGYKPNGEEMQWWLRSPHGTSKDYGVWDFLTDGRINCILDVGSTYSRLVVRPCFYISADFFRNVKLDTQNLGGEVKKAILENVTYEQAEKIYSDIELSDIGYDVHNIRFDNPSLKKIGNKTVFKAFVSNHLRNEQTFKLIAAVCENGALAEISQTDYTLSGSESRRVVSVSADLNNVKDLSSAKIKVFAFLDYKTLIPLSSVVMNGEIDKLLAAETEKYEKAEITIPDAYQNIYNQEDAYFDVSVVYAGNSQKTYTVSYTFDDWKTQTDENITVSDIENLKKRIKVTNAPLGENVIKIKLTSDDGEKAQKERKFSVIKFYTEKPLDKYYNVATGEPFDWYTIPKDYVTLLKNFGFTALRTTPSWNVAEREKGKLAIAENSNAANNIETYVENGINVSTLTVGYGNKYYTHNTATSRPDMQPPIEKDEIDAFANYAANVPSLLKSKDGKTLSFKRYEIWNEPNISTYWGYEEGSVPDPIQYVYMLNHTAAKIKQANPDVIIAAGALAAGNMNDYTDHQNYLNIMYDLGMLKYADEYSFHPYMYPKNPDTGYRSNGVSVSITNDYVYNLNSRYLAPRKAHGGWIEAAVSEVGWSTYVDSSNMNEIYDGMGRSGTSEDDQAIFIIKALVYNNYLDISHTDVFTAYDRGTDINYVEHNFGFIRNDYSVKPAGYALSQYNNTCSSAQYIGRVELAEDVYGYVYQSLTKPFMIVWKKMMNVNTGTPYQYTLPSGARAENMFGNAISGENIKIGTEPVYVYDIPLTLVKDAFNDLSIDAFKDFSSYAQYKTLLDDYISLNTMPTAEKQLEMLDNMYAFGKAVINEKAANANLMRDNDFMYALFEVYQATKRMAAAYAMYDAKYETSDSAVESLNAAILAKKDNQSETSLLFTDAIARYAKRYNKTANEVRQAENFTGKTGFTAMNDYLAKNLCAWAMDIMATETVDISRALLPYAKSKIETNANESYTLNFTLDSMLTIPFESLAYIADGNGVARSAKTALNVDANSSASVDLTGNSVSTAGEYTYYIAVENNGKVTIKQPFTLTVK